MIAVQDRHLACRGFSVSWPGSRPIEALPLQDCCSETWLTSKPLITLKFSQIKTIYVARERDKKFSAH